MTANATQQARDAIASAVNRIGRLTLDGVQPPFYFGRCFEDDRAEILSLLTPGAHPFETRIFDEIERSSTWVGQRIWTKTVNRRHTSYGYKHMVELWSRNQKLTCSYVCNGAFIVAAVALGVPFQVIDSVNVLFGFHERDLNRAEHKEREIEARENEAARRAGIRR